MIERAVAQGIQRFVIPGVDLPTSRSALALAQSHPGLIYAALGSHPNEPERWDTQARDEMRRLAEKPWVIAIGEIGLDFYRELGSHEQQIKKFKEQLALAAEVALPVIVHNRQAMNTLMPILSEWYSTLSTQAPGLETHPGILHAFEGSLEEGRALIAMNFLIGVGGPVTYKNAPGKQAVVAALPLEALMTETDAPYLSPHPYRGQRNEPKNILPIAEKIALLHNRPLSEVASQIYQNAARVFAWGV